MRLIAPAFARFFRAAADTPGAPPAANPPLTAQEQAFVERFKAANTTHDGRLTLAQAQAAGMRMIAEHFAQIDTVNAGYVTLPVIRAWHQARQAAQT